MNPMEQLTPLSTGFFFPESTGQHFHYGCNVFFIWVSIVIIIVRVQRKKKDEKISETITLTILLILDTTTKQITGAIPQWCSSLISPQASKIPSNARQIPEVGYVI
jgi:hypothetical protein